jgi:hypothetical protein
MTRSGSEKYIVSVISCPCTVMNRKWDIWKLAFYCSAGRDSSASVLSSGSRNRGSIASKD